MKKTTLVASIVASSLLGVGGASLYCVWRTQQQLNQFHAALADYPILRLVHRSKSYRPWHSEELASYQLGCDNLLNSPLPDGERPSITVRHVVSLNPFAPGVRSELVLPAALQENMKTLFGEQAPLSMDTRRRWDGSLDMRLSNPAFSVDKGGRQIKWQGMTLDMQYDAAQQRLDSQLRQPGLLLSDAQLGWVIELQALTVRSHSRRTPSGAWLGSDEGQLDGMRFSLPNPDGVIDIRSGKLQLHNQGREQNGLVNSDSRASLADMRFNGKALGTLSFQGSVSGLNAAALAQSQQLSLRQGLLQCRDDSTLLHPAQRPLLLQLLSAKPALDTLLALGTPQGNARLQLQMRLLQAVTGQESWAQWQNKVALQAELSWPQGLPERWIRDFAPAPEQQHWLMQYRQLLASSLQGGQLRQNGQQLSAQLQLGGGKLLLNGQPLTAPLPALPSQSALADSPSPETAP